MFILYFRKNGKNCGTSKLYVSSPLCVNTVKISAPTSCSNGSFPPVPLKNVIIFNHWHHDSPETVVLSLEDSRLLSLLLQNQEALRDTENTQAQAQTHLQTGQLLQDHSHGNW